MTNAITYLLVIILALAAAAVLLRSRRGPVSRWRREGRLRGRVLLEDALKHLHECEYQGHRASLQSMAGALSIHADGASALAARMQERGLLRARGDALRLTPAGAEYALQVIRAHRLWERFLADRTGVAESSWHERAERREHALTPGEADALAQTLGNPRFDPHGDPIPTANGAMPEPRAATPLNAFPVDRPARITHIEDEPAAVYAQLVAAGLHTGMDVRILESSPERVRFWADGDEHILAPILAANVSVEELPAEHGGEADGPSERLSDLLPGESGEILFISRACRGLERRRLMDLGIVPGTTIEATMRSPSGDPTAYHIRGTTIAIRKQQADYIRVRRAAREVAI